MTVSTSPPAAAQSFSTEARFAIRRPSGGSAQIATPDGFVDAAWWPRSYDLEAELPGLLAGLWADGRDITHARYDLATWGTPARHAVMRGRRMRLGGFRFQSPLVLSLSNARHSVRVDVLVIPVDTDEAVARRALDLVDTPGNLDRPDQIMEAARA